MLDILVEDPLSNVLWWHLMQALQAFGLIFVFVEEGFAYASGDACSTGYHADCPLFQHGVGQKFIVRAELLC